MNSKIVLSMVLLAAIAAVPLAQPAHAAIPDWVKVIASSWANDQTTDAQFIDAIEHLIAADIIKITSIPTDDALTIGFIPVEKAETLTPKAESLEEYLEAELGVDVELEIPTNYETIIEGLRFGHIDAAFMDTGPGWMAHSLSGADVVMAEVKKDGKIYYQATAWVLADNDSIDSIEDTIGKRVSFTSITGSSGFIRPFGALVANGHVQVNGDDVIALEEAINDAFASHIFPGGYQGSIAALVAGQVDVAFGNDALSDLLDPEERGLVKPAFTLGPVPSHVFVVSSDMTENTRKALIDAMLGLNHDDNNQILRNLYGAQAMLPTTTTLHIGSFGEYLDALPGLSQKILDKKDFR